MSQRKLWLGEETWLFSVGKFIDLLRTSICTQWSAERHEEGLYLALVHIFSCCVIIVPL